MRLELCDCESVGPISEIQSVRASGSDRLLDHVDHRHRAFRLSARFFRFSPRAEVLLISSALGCIIVSIIAWT